MKGRLPTIGKEQQAQINEDIRDSEVRLIGSDGAQLGIVSSAAAMAMAVEANLDLVKIAPGAVPPVCKIMDYGKYRYEQQKREKEARKNQRVVEIKEVRLSLGIDTHDFNTKLSMAKRFLEGGDRVKVSIRFRGREMGHTSFGVDMMKKFAEALGDAASMEKPPKVEGRSMQMFLSAKQAVPPKAPSKKSEPKPEQPEAEGKAEAKAETPKAPRKSAPKPEAPKAEPEAGADNG